MNNLNHPAGSATWLRLWSHQENNLDHPAHTRTWLRKVAVWATNLDHPGRCDDVVEESCRPSPPS